MKIKEFLKKTAKAGGKGLLKSALDPKTWIVVYMAVLATKGYNKINRTLESEAALNKAAAKRIEQMTATPEQMKKVCEVYDLTEEQVQEVIDTQNDMSKTELAVVKTAQDSKKSWRDWLPGAKSLRQTGVQKGTSLEVPGQAALALDAYEQAEQAQRQLEQRAKAAAIQGK